MNRTVNGTPRARALGAELRKAREDCGIGVRQLARLLGTDHSKLSRCEGGQTIPTSEYVASVLTVLGVSETERDRIAEMARGATEPNWLSSGVPGVRHELTTLIEFERTAKQITDVSTQVFPGLLQTADYARAVLTGVPGNEVEARVTMRVGRRDVLTRKNGPKFHGIIAEAALRSPIGGHAVLTEQIRYVRELAEWPTVTLQVLPGDVQRWHPAHAGAYVLFEFGKSNPIVHLEHLRSAVFLYEAKDLDAYVEATDTLHELAMEPAESVEFIDRVAEEMERAA